MIICVNSHNINRHGNAIKAQYQLRYKAFIERQSYKVFSYNDMEYDQYDNPSAVYLVYQGSNGQAYGVSRLTPVSHRSMLADLYPDMVEDHSIFESNTIWEGTRFCVEKNLSRHFRNHIAKELVAAYFEFGLINNVSHVIGMMPSYILRKVFSDNGCKFSILGKSKIIDGQTIQAASMQITQEAFDTFRQVSGIDYQVLNFDMNIVEAA